VLSYRVPAIGAQINLTLPFDFNVTMTTNSIGQAFYQGGYDVVPGTYDVTATYNGLTVAATVTVAAGEIEQFTINVP